MIQKESLSIEIAETSFESNSSVCNYYTFTKQRNTRLEMVDYLLAHVEMIGPIMKENSEQLSSKVSIYQIFACEGHKQISKYLISLKNRLFSQEQQMRMRPRQVRKKMCPYEQKMDMFVLCESLKQFQELSQNMVAKYLAGVRSTIFQVCLYQTFGDHNDKLIREIIKTKAYQDIDSLFFNKFPSYVLHQQKSPLQFTLDFTKILDSDINIAIHLVGEIERLQEKWSIFLLNSRFRQFNLSMIIEEFEDDFILKILRTRYANNKAKLVKDLIDFRVFSDPKYQFLQQFHFHENIKSQIKDEILQNSSSCLKKLKKCITIINMINEEQSL